MRLEEARQQYERWLRATQDLSAHTVRAYTSDVYALEQSLGPCFDARKLSSTDLYGFIEQLTANGRASTTVRRRFSGICSLCRWLVQTEILETDPTAELDVRFKRARRLPRAVSPSDLRRLLRHLSSNAEISTDFLGPSGGPNRHTETTTLIAVILMVGTGMRVGELTQTHMSQVDLPSRTIRVVGKGLRERMVYLSNEWVVSLLASHVQATIARATESTDPTLLVNRSGNPLTTSALRARLERAGIAAGLGSKLTPHMLRHTAATQLIESGVDIRFVQRLLGHASLTTTEIYTHVADRSLRHAVTEADVLGSFLALR